MNNYCRGCSSLISASVFGALCSRCAWVQKLTEDDIDQLTGRRRKKCRPTRAGGFFGSRSEELALERLSLDLLDDDGHLGHDNFDGVFTRFQRRADGQRWVMN